MDEAKTLSDQGVALYKKGKYKDALPYFDKAIELDPENSEFYNHKGRALKRLGDPGHLKYLAKAIELSMKKNNL
jgi:Flp pilus assembly protein TadD